MPDLITAIDVARRLAETLENHGISYAIGGALALGYYATPRATVDVDINIFVSPSDGLDDLLAILDRCGFTPDDSTNLLREAMEDGQFRGRMSGIRVDIFVPSIAFYAEMATRRRQVPVPGGDFYIIAPDDLVILKMMFFRRKDLADVEAILRESGETLDRVSIRHKLIEFVGEEDERIREWDGIVTDVFD